MELNMACDKKDKILCCTKIYQKIFTYNRNTNTLESVLFIKPLFCGSICPEDCEINEYDEGSSDLQYITTSVNSCEECRENSGCTSNLAVYFEKSTCSLQQKIVSSSEEAESFISDDMGLVLYKECTSVLLSDSSPSEYQNVLLENAEKSSDCIRPCCYLMTNNKYGCIKIPKPYCDKEKIHQFIDNEIEILDTIVIDDENSDCENANCFPGSTKDNLSAFTKSDNYNCGACCINDTCYEICDSDAEGADVYVNQVLGLEKPILKYELAKFGPRVSASQICKTLQGKFLGYNTLCDQGRCSHYKIIIK
jgi:hypothetical protein